MTSRRLSRTVGIATALVGSLVLSSGCYTYRAMEVPPPGSMVRAHVPVVSALTGNNEGRTESIEGRVVTAGDTLKLAIMNRQEYGAYREVIRYDTLSLGRAQTSLIEVREFSPRRSVVMGSIIAVGAGTAAVLAFNAVGGQQGNDTPRDPGPQSAIVISGSLVSSLVGLILR